MTLDRNQLKAVAFITMFLDHFAGMFLVDTIFYYPLRMAGRVAFPLFLFLLVEGFYYTHSRQKYAFRLLLFAVVSQVPYTLVTGLYNLNVGFELLSCFCLLFFLDRRDWLGCVLAVLVSSFAEYNLLGIILCLAFYGWRVNRRRFCPLLLFGLALVSFAFGCTGLLAYPVLLLYRGNVRPVRTFPRWLSYGFYPVHLLVLWLFSFSGLTPCLIRG
ncbi:MAG TPA: hypothetical protein IAA51_06770 [Candidatus Cottocaccamicrobium excrementipullorum]|nr:hypothetical protein [Candidatus Cottocaccamicrobium excrementipullorum]